MIMKRVIDALKIPLYYVLELMSNVQYSNVSMDTNKGKVLSLSGVYLQFSNAY